MKNTSIILAISLAFACNLLQAQSPSVKKFYNKYNDHEASTAMKIPTWLLHLGLSIASHDEDMDKSEKAIFEVAKKVQNLRFLVVKNAEIVDKNDLHDLRLAMRTEAFEPLIDIRQGKKTVSVFVKDHQNEKQEYLCLIAETDFVMLSFKGKFNEEDIIKIINSGE